MLNISPLAMAQINKCILISNYGLFLFKIYLYQNATIFLIQPIIEATAEIPKVFLFIFWEI